MRKAEKPMFAIALQNLSIFWGKTVQSLFLAILHGVHAAVQILFLKACEKKMVSQDTKGAHEAVVLAQAWPTFSQELYYDTAT